MTDIDARLDWGSELSSFDYLMFRSDLDVRSRTTVMSIETFDVVPDWDRLRWEVDRVSRVALRLRQRVVAPVIPLTAPRWVVDPDFDLDYHLRRVQLPGTTTIRQLLDFAQTMFHDPLDPNRPLWEAVLVEGLDDDGARAAMIWKLSHATIDGVGGMVIDHLLRTDHRDTQRPAMPPLPVPEDLTSVELTRRAVRRLPLGLAASAVRRMRAAGGLAGRAMRDPAGTLGSVQQAVHAARHALPSGTEPSPILRGRSLQRRFEIYDLPLADLRNAARAHQCSLNDAYLAAIGGAMRHYHEGMGVDIDAITVGMPINVRSATDPAGGNQWSAAAITVPVADTDPVSRMATIRQRVITARSDAGFNLIGLVSPVTAWLPRSVLASINVGSVGIDLQASNVPGSPVPRYMAGARIVRQIPIGPLPGVAMMATMTSMAGRLFLGFNVDPAAFTDAELLRSSLRAGFDEVVAAGRSAEPVRAPDPAGTSSRHRAKRAATKQTATKATKPAKPVKAAQRGATRQATGATRTTTRSRRRTSR